MIRITFRCDYDILYVNSVAYVFNVDKTTLAEFRLKHFPQVSLKNKSLFLRHIWRVAVWIFTLGALYKHFVHLLFSRFLYPVRFGSKTKQPSQTTRTLSRRFQAIIIPSISIDIWCFMRHLPALNNSTTSFYMHLSFLRESTTIN